MTEYLSGLTWFELKFKPLLIGDFEFNYVDEKGGDLGDLSGVQFDSKKWVVIYIFGVLGMWVTNWLII